MLSSQSHGITVREIKESDLAQYRDLRLEALRSAPTAFGADYQESLQLPGSAWLERLRGNVGSHQQTIFVAEKDGLLLGMTGVQRGGGAKRQHTATVWGVYLRSNARGQGLAGTLLAHAMLWAQQMGVTRLELHVSTTNEKAVTLYQSAGFVIVGTLRDALRVGEESVDMYILERVL
jgi:ribosomal protein S18 acetylase RimI-like enzyme